MSTLLILATATHIAVSRLTEDQVEQAQQFPLTEGTSRYIVNESSDLGDLPSSLLLGAYNATKAKPIKGFHDRTKAESGGWQAFNVLAGKNGEPVPFTAPVAPTQEGEPMAATATKKGSKKGSKKAATKAAAKNGHREISMEPKAKNKDQIVAARAGSKTATMLDLLAEGATLTEIGDALSKKGKPINARAWVTGFHRFGYGVKKVDERKGEPVYRLVYPNGMRQPLAHKVAKSAEGEE